MERDSISIYDGIMRGFTYEDAVIMLRNTNPDRGDVWETMKKDLRKWVRENVADMMYLLDQHKDEVWAAAYPDEVRPLRNHPNWNSERLEALAWEIQKWLRAHDMWIDVCIYYDGKRMSTARNTDDNHWEFRYNGEPFIEDSMDPRHYFEYVANPHILSMSFEGPLCHLLAYGVGGSKLVDEFNAIFRRYGLYFELGDHWNLTCYE